MASTVRFGKKLRMPSVRLKDQVVKATAEIDSGKISPRAIGCAVTKRNPSGAASDTPIKLLNGRTGSNFTRLYAHIVEEDGAFTVRVRMLNHLRYDEACWGEEIAATFDMASLMVDSLAREFSIPQECISMKIVMRRFKDGIIH